MRAVEGVASLEGYDVASSDAFERRSTLYGGEANVSEVEVLWYIERLQPPGDVDRPPLRHLSDQGMPIILRT